jgi:hypothetical protein
MSCKIVLVAIFGEKGMMWWCCSTSLLTGDFKWGELARALKLT